MFLRAALSLLFLLMVLPTQAEEKPSPEVEFEALASAQLCPNNNKTEEQENSEDELDEGSGEGSDEYDDELPICFVRSFAIEGNWAAVRLAYERMTDSFYVFQLQAGKWVKVVSSAYPDWEYAHDQAPDLPEASFNKLSEELFPADEE